MRDPEPLSEEDRINLVAFLDGELSGPRARAMQARLSLDPVVRAEADALRRAWNLLDFLPRPEPSPAFTSRTLDRISPVGTRRSNPAKQGRWRSRLLGLGWAAAVLLAAGLGYGVGSRWGPREPGEKDLVRDLRLIEYKHYYDLIEDFDFLRELDQPDLFGEDGQDS